MEMFFWSQDYINGREIHFRAGSFADRAAILLVESAYKECGEVWVKNYRFVYTIRGPSEETEDKYLAEIPALPGCRAWGDTEAEALDYVRSVAVAFLESYEGSDDELPLLQVIRAQTDESS